MNGDRGTASLHSVIEDPVYFESIAPQLVCESLNPLADLLSRVHYFISSAASRVATASACAGLPQPTEALGPIVPLTSRVNRRTLQVRTWFGGFSDVTTKTASPPLTARSSWMRVPWSFIALAENHKA